MSATSRCPIRGWTSSRRSPHSAKIIETQLGFVDIAGLVRGASKGEGLGNQFLGNIREVDAIVHVLRCFENDDIQHVENKVDPIADAETVETELMLSDLESLEKRVPNLAKKAAQGDKEAKIAASVLGQALDLLREGKPARLTEPKDDEEARVFAQAQLLTAKPVLYVCNVDEERRRERQRPFGARVRQGEGGRRRGGGRLRRDRGGDRDAWHPTERGEFLAELGLDETGLARVIRAGYELLHLITFFTVGPKEARAWTVASRRQGAAGGGRDPHRFRTRLHPRRDDRLSTIMSRLAAKPARARPASCARKARTMSSRTAT